MCSTCGLRCATQCNYRQLTSCAAPGLLLLAPAVPHAQSNTPLVQACACNSSIHADEGAHIICRPRTCRLLKQGSPHVHRAPCTLRMQPTVTALAYKGPCRTEQPPTANAQAALSQRAPFGMSSPFHHPLRLSPRVRTRCSDLRARRAAGEARVRKASVLADIDLLDGLWELEEPRGYWRGGVWLGQLHASCLPVCHAAPGKPALSSVQRAFHEYHSAHAWYCRQGCI